MDSLDFMQLKYSDHGNCLGVSFTIGHKVRLLFVKLAGQTSPVVRRSLLLIMTI